MKEENMDRTVSLPNQPDKTATGKAYLKTLLSVLSQHTCRHVDVFLSCLPTKFCLNAPLTCVILEADWLSWQLWVSEATTPIQRNRIFILQLTYYSRPFLTTPAAEAPNVTLLLCRKVMIRAVIVVFADALSYCCQSSKIVIATFIPKLCACLVDVSTMM